MSDEWPEVFINDLKGKTKNAIAMGPFGSRIKAENFVDKGIPIIKGGNLNGDFLLENNYDYLTEEKADELISSNAFRRDIVITHRGTIGQVGIIPDDSKYERYVVSQSQLKILLDQEKVNPYFIYYFLRSPIGQHRLLLNASQVGVPAIAQASTSVKKILVPFPDKIIQNKIVEILLCLDHKIITNRKINQTLEQVAQAIFKSWFVDFDPVKAKISVLKAGGTEKEADVAAMQIISGKSEDKLLELKRGSPEKYAELKATAELFPAAMVDSELGQIPEGWGVKPLSEQINIIGGGTPKRSEEKFWNGNICWFSIKDLPNGSDLFVIDTQEKITNQGLIKSSTKILPNYTTIITARGTVGKVALVATEMAMNQSCYGIRPISDIGLFYNFFNLKNATKTLKNITHGAVFDTITTKTFESYIQSFPEEFLTITFDETVFPLLKLIEKNVREVQKLAEMRDLLLPKLLSGEMRNDALRGIGDSINTGG